MAGLCESGCASDRDCAQDRPRCACACAFGRSSGRRDTGSAGERARCAAGVHGRTLEQRQLAVLRSAKRRSAPLLEGRRQDADGGGRLADLARRQDSRRDVLLRSWAAEGIVRVLPEQGGRPYGRQAVRPSVRRECGLTFRNRHQTTVSTRRRRRHNEPERRPHPPHRHRRQARPRHRRLRQMDRPARPRTSRHPTQAPQPRSGIPRTDRPEPPRLT